MTFNTRMITAAGAALLLIAAGMFAVRAQDAAPEPTPAPPAADAAAAPEPVRNPDDIVARVGDQTINERELAIVSEVLASQLASMPPAQQRSVLIDTLIGMKLLALAGRDAGLEEAPEYKAQVAFLEMQALRNAYADQAIVNALTDAELQEGYQTFVVGEHQAQEQVRARHILVDTKETAEQIIAELKAGSTFEELAKQSKDPSGQNGGDLGFFGKGQMVPAFEAAAFALEPGAITETPVQSEFGWHVIKVEEKRMSGPPPFDAVEAQLRTYMERQKFETVLAELRQKYLVEIVGQPAAAPPPAATPPAAPEPASAAEQPAAEGEAAPVEGEAPQ